MIEIKKKQLDFIRVKYKNIMSVGDEPIDLDLSKFQKTLCTGKNGAGKSTMLEAIYFALFGKPFRDITKNQLINETSGKNLLVELWLEYEDKVYHITRGIKPNKFAITCDGNTIDAAASVKDFQAYFEDMIGMNATSFKQIVVLGTAGYTPFMQLKAPERRKLVEDLLEVSVLAQMDKLNKARIKELNQGIANADVTINHITAQLKSYRDHQNNSNASNAAAVADHEATFNEARDKAREIKARIDDLTEQLTSFEMPASPADELGKFTMARAKAAAQHDQFAGIAHMHEGGGTCPTCMQQFDDPDLLSKLRDKMSTIQGQLDKADNRIDELNRKMVEYNEAAVKFRDIQSQINAEKQSVALYVNQAKAAKASIDRLNADRPDYTKEIGELNNELISKIDDKSVIEREKHQRTMISDLLKDSGVKAVIMARYMPHFNNRIAYYLDIMEADFGFTLDAEFKEVIKSAGRSTFSYNSFSQGEKARIDMAVMFAWRDLASEVSGVDVNALFMDEVFDGPSDGDAQGAVFAIIEKMKANVFIISHSEHDPQNFDRHVKMSKLGRTSVMEEVIFDVLQSCNDQS
ncbi:exonuclease subunit 2 [Aeromonas phage B614]|nr:exonuclease subunit 2 [Aeromonas phage B614]UYD58150.1 exonuclease subunit 2 [Aeromonas phage UP87]UYD58513.1 exonuclease subunit 2 [Aeromonas phage avDM14-QBC]UYD58728.1 exonuclease subunit 2 [Aeromonas phage avDM10-HWA]UYD58968.1 exonuclease subunit 2 [Aeromonas phage avDM7-IJDJ]UYD59779.1 exonuclease subunit 2 [Aeromonas phage avDM9-HANS]